MKQKVGKALRSRVVRTVLLVVLALSLGGAAWGLKKSYIPGPVSALQLNGEPLNGYGSHAEFERECLHCHAPVRCLSANLCQDCHREIARERAEAEGLHGLLPGTEKCQTCHPEHRGSETALAEVAFGSINHEHLSGFSLGKHAVDYGGEALTCQSCHANGGHEATSAGCEACHAAEAREEMAAHVEEHGERCVGCHDGQDRMMGFEHSEYYELEGAHGAADCGECHPGLEFGEGVRGCEACHPEPEVHAGEFGVDCARCHTAMGWSPAQLTVHVFRLDHGGQGEAGCEVCHPGTYAEYGCYGCHEHEAGEMEGVHGAEGIGGELEPCGECHPTGASGEARGSGDGA